MGNPWPSVGSFRDRQWGDQLAVNGDFSVAADNEKQTTIFCTSVAADPRCPDCGRDRRCRDTVIRALTDLAVPTWGHEQT